MKILVVSSYLPYPLHSGGHVRLYNLIKELSLRHDITLICEIRKNQTDSDKSEVEKICKKVVTVERRRQWGIGNIIKTSLSINSFLTTGHTSREMRDLIRREVSDGSYDLIHVETFYVMQNLPNTTLPVVLAEHNIEYMVYKRFVESASLLVRPMLRLDIKKIKREEQKLWKKANKVIAVSEKDADEMRKFGIKSEIVSNGVDINKFSFKRPVISHQSSVKKILFIGDFKWLQNRDAVRYIIKDIWPKVRQKAKSQNLEVNLWIVGRYIPDSIKVMSNDQDILFDEKSSSNPTEQIFQEADILLAPIRIGGGTSYKILESMSTGTPVTTTSMSAEAIGAKDGLELMIGDNADQLADKAIILMQNEELYAKIAKNGRKLIEEKYTWKKIAEDLEKVYRELGIRN